MVKPWEEPGYNAAEDELNGFGFLPSKSYGYAFTVLFGIITAVHLVQGIMSRRWWLSTIVIGGLAQVVGWGCRLWGAFNPHADNSFLIQTCVLVIGPSFFSAAIYAMMGWVITYVAPEQSFLRPKLYWIIFISCDFVSLCLQGYGGGQAATADDKAGSDLGTHVMLAGIIFQLVITIVFAIMSFLWYRKAHEANAFERLANHRVKYLIWGIAAATLLVIARGCYRTPELAQGWSGYLITHEVWFLFDAIPMFLTMVVLAIAHPCWTFPLSVEKGEPQAPWSKKEGVRARSASNSEENILPMEEAREKQGNFYQTPYDPSPYEQAPYDPHYPRQYEAHRQQNSAV